ncbi:hypothetical protein LOD99_8239 [Oopsacas minuta]|uniref:Uncharacterized protein n=1 Tax=Oopsacas minuta TaxID=111878 RepID=A0AAV7JH13_9METZ|nr:hypothetical protein LOD99_8239 [Oopsacas minuta]
MASAIHVSDHIPSSFQNLQKRLDQFREAAMNDLALNISYVSLFWPINVLEDIIDNMCIFEQQNNSIQKNTEFHLELNKFADSLEDPWGIAIDSANDLVYITERYFDKVRIFCRCYGTCIGCIEGEKLQFPENIILKHISVIVQCRDYYNVSLVVLSMNLEEERRITLKDYPLQAFSIEGILTRTVIPLQLLKFPRCFSLDQQLNVIIGGVDDVKIFSNEGKYKTKFGRNDLILFKLQKTRVEIYESLQEHFPDLATVERWYREFIHGNFVLVDAPRSGRPNILHNEENVNEMLDLITKDPHTTYAQLEYETELSSGTINIILHKELCVRKLCARWIAHSLNLQRNISRIDFCKIMLKRFANGSSRAVSEILTGDETWIYHYDPETKRMSKEWVEEDALPPTKVRRARSVGNKCGRFFSDLVGLSKLLLSRIERLLLPTGTLQCAYPKSSQQLSHSGRRQALEEFFFIMIMHHRIRQSELVSFWKILDSKHYLTHPTVLI